MIYCLTVFLFLNSPFAFSSQIECEVEKYAWYNLGSLTTCRIRKIYSLNSNSNEIQIKTVTNSSEIEALWTGTVTTARLPRVFQKNFKNLLVINFRYANLKQIYREDLTEFENLKSVDFSYNDIELLEENAFADNGKLERIILSNNKIKFVHSKAFQHLDNLRILDLNENTCIKSKASSAKNLQALLHQVNLHCSCQIDIYRKYLIAKKFHRNVPKNLKEVEDLFTRNEVCQEDVLELREIIRNQVLDMVKLQEELSKYGEVN